VTTNGGAQVRWRRDGKELFYVALDSKIMAVSIRIASNSKVVVDGVPSRCLQLTVELFNPITRSNTWSLQTVNGSG